MNFKAVFMVHIHVQCAYFPNVLHNKDNNYCQLSLFNKKKKIYLAQGFFADLGCILAA